MILFFSSAFLRQLRLIWKPSLKAFLVGERNLFFFVPDSVVEVEQIAPETINLFLEEKNFSGNWQLLGFLSAEELPEIPGYVRVSTQGIGEPANWSAVISLYDESGPLEQKIEIRTSNEIPLPT